MESKKENKWRQMKPEHKVMLALGIIFTVVTIYNTALETKYYRLAIKNLQRSLKG